MQISLQNSIIQSSEIGKGNDSLTRNHALTRHSVDWSERWALQSNWNIQEAQSNSIDLHHICIEDVFLRGKDASSDLFGLGQQPIEWESSMTLAIKTWHVTDTAGENGEFVHIHGRESGLISFFLALLGISPTTTLVVDAKSIRLEQGSLSGFDRSVTPISQVTTVSFGYVKPWKQAIVITAILGMLLVFMPIFGQLIAALVGFAYYYLKKELFIKYFAPGIKETVEFKRSLIEGQNIDERAGERIVSIIEMLVLGLDKPRALGDRPDGPNSVKDALSRAGEELTSVAERTRQRADSIASQAKEMGGRAVDKISPLMATAVSASAVAGGIPVRCPNCGVGVSAESAFCGECGQKVR